MIMLTFTNIMWINDLFVALQHKSGLNSAPVGVVHAK